jgi:hypothetical protein
MPLAVKHRFLAVAATALIGVIAIALLRGSISLDVAAMRAVVLVVIVVVIDRVVMPWVQLALAARDDGIGNGPDPR